MHKRYLVPSIAILAVVAAILVLAQPVNVGTCTGASATACKVKIKGDWYIRFTIKIGSDQGTVHGSASYPVAGGTTSSTGADGSSGGTIVHVTVAPPSGSTSVTASAEGYNSQGQRVCGPNTWSAITMDSLNVCP